MSLDLTKFTPIERSHNAYLDSILGQPFPVLDSGFIRIIDYLGDDRAIVQAARTSYGKGTKHVNSDRGLIRYLLRHQHWSPFEQANLKYHARMPIFVARQWIRHKAHLNEASARYSEMSEDDYIPSIERLVKQSVKNKQGSGEPLTLDEQKLIQENIAEVYAFSNAIYNKFIKLELTRELARIVKSTGSYTEWYWSTNLRDLLHFCRQRCDSHAQYEIRVYANILRDEILKNWVPNVYEAYIDYIENATTLSGPQQRYIKELNKLEGLGKEMFLKEKPDYLAAEELDQVQTWLKSMNLL